MRALTLRVVIRLRLGIALPIFLPSVHVGPKGAGASDPSSRLITLYPFAPVVAFDLGASQARPEHRPELLARRNGHSRRRSPQPSLPSLGTSPHNTRRVSRA